MEIHVNYAIIKFARSHLYPEAPMNITYDPQIDVLRIMFKETPVKESDNTKPGVILDYDRDGKIVGMEIMNASQQVANPETVQYSVTLSKASSDLDKEAEPALSLEKRQAFMALPLEERRRILAAQAEAMVAHYQQDTEWQELLAGDIIDY